MVKIFKIMKMLNEAVRLDAMGNRWISYTDGMPEPGASIWYRFLVDRSKFEISIFRARSSRMMKMRTDGGMSGTGETGARRGIQRCLNRRDRTGGGRAIRGNMVLQCNRTGAWGNRRPLIVKRGTAELVRTRRIQRTWSGIDRTIIMAAIIDIRY